METRLQLLIQARDLFVEGKPFGETGAYERLVGRVHFAVDRKAQHQQGIVNLDKAPLNTDGLVECASDFCILKPVDLDRGNRRLLFDFCNRGNKRILQCFNDAPHTNNPRTAADAGNGFLLRRGYTLVWAAWQGDILPGQGGIILDVPTAADNGREITGLVRSEFIADAPGVTCYPLSSQIFARSYPTISLDTTRATFSRRQYVTDERKLISPSEWQFARVEGDRKLGIECGEVIPSNSHVYLPAGFEPGWIYELVYVGTNPVVLGLGYAAVRELVSFLKYSHKDSNGGANPLRQGSSRVEKAYCFGRSQAGRVIRTTFIVDLTPTVAAAVFSMARFAMLRAPGASP